MFMVRFKFSWSSCYIFLLLLLHFCNENSHQVALQLEGYSKNNASSHQVQHEFAPADQDYAVIVDCGSSGSRAHIFWWPSNATGSDLSLMKSIRPVLKANGKPLTIKIKPGLASVRDQPEAASDYMKPLMDSVVSSLPYEVRRETPIYFLGTAGLRLLSQVEQKQILDDIANDFKVMYDFPEIYTSVISGSQEGAYQWIGVNAIAGRFDRKYEPSTENFFCRSPLTRRFGIIEMGGASIQVSYELELETNYLIEHTLKKNPEAFKAYKASLISIKLGRSKPKTLFSTTFLGLGSNSARDAAIDLLVRESLRHPNHHLIATAAQLVNTLRSFMPILQAPSDSRTIVVDDPCLPRGAEETVAKPVDLLFSREKTIGYTAKTGAITIDIRLVGMGNYPRCQDLLIRLIRVAKQERLLCDQHYDVYAQNYCSTSLLGTAFAPFRYLQFLGLSEFYYTTDEMLHTSGPFDGVLVQKKTSEICSTPYKVLLERFPEANRGDDTRVQYECFKSTWILTWLYVAMRLPSKFASDFATVNKLNGSSLDWTFGAAIAKVFEDRVAKEH